MLSLPEEFLSPEEETEIMHAVERAEENCSAEFRVHLESKPQDDHHKRAQEVFKELKMHVTDDKNGVLFYIGGDDHNEFIILAGEWIEKDVPQNFWEEVYQIVNSQFGEGDYKNGLILGLLEAGELLKPYFPHEGDDLNELPDFVSKS